MGLAPSAKFILCAIMLTAGIGLGSCTGEAPEKLELASAAPTVETVETVESHGVRFYVDGREVSNQTVDHGQFPEVPEVDDVEGARFTGWIDDKGRRAEPAVTPVEGECSYSAVFMPVLDGNGPYLFTDGDGLLHPDAVLDSTELSTALDALAGEAAKAYFPESFSADDSITADELRNVLASFFTYEEMDRVILGFEDVDKLSKAQFAIIMNRLLGRATDEKVVVSESAYCVPDITTGRADYTELMEAAVEHTHSNDGAHWRNILLPAIYGEGYVLLEGGLYLVDENGYFVTDTVIGSMTFGYDGRYTSGDSTLDAYIRSVITDIAETIPEATALEMLEAAYDYCCENFGYMRRNFYEFGAQGWEIAEAITMFDAQSGNSYSYAATFWALARGLGFEATAVNGAVGKDMAAHAWVEIEIDGEIYIFDPAMEAGALEGVEAGRDMFMKTEAQTALHAYYKG